LPLGFEKQAAMDDDGSRLIIRQPGSGRLRYNAGRYVGECSGNDKIGVLE